MKDLRHFYYSKNPRFRAIANAIDHSRNTSFLSNFGINMGSLGRALANRFPQMVRVNRHHRNRFAGKIVKQNRSHFSEFRGWFGHPAKIECVN